MVASNKELEDVLRQIQSWPIANRLILAGRVLEMVGQQAATQSPTKGSPANAVLGLLSPSGSAPDDAACRHIIEEELLRKHAS